MGPRLVEVERSGGQRGTGVRLIAPVYEEQSHLVILMRLRNVCLIAALRLPAVLGLVSGPPAVVAGVVVGSLVLAASTARNATTRLILLARPTLTAARLPRSRRTQGLPLLSLALAGKPLLLGEEKLAINGDRL